MKNTRRDIMWAGGVAGVAAAGLFGWSERGGAKPQADFPLKLTDAEWRKRLPPAAYRTLRHEATEAPYSSPLNAEKRAGTYVCAGCALPLYSARTKFESGTGWPSFWRPLPDAIGTRQDRSLGFGRTEVHCARCGGHLGHVFDDGPKPTGLRYCMNGVAMNFVAGKA